MFKKVRKFYKRHQHKFVADSYDYEAFADAEESTMEFDMGATTGQVDERIAFGPMAKGQKRYGSTSTRGHMKDDSNGFSYTVQPGDTVQGLAVKFRITTEQIRRSNQLWTNDSLFLRDKLIIPIQLDNGHQVNSESSTSSVSSLGPGESRNSAASNGSSNSKRNSSHNGISRPLNGAMTPSDLSFQSPEPMSTSSKPWTHPLSDSFEGDDGVTTPESIKLDTDTPPSPNGSNQNGTGPYVDSHVSDHSEKTASEFLSRIDVAIASTKQKTLPRNQNGTSPWVTFDSDSDYEQHHNRPGTSVLVEGRHLRHSLRKLEKKQDELFQL